MGNQNVPSVYNQAEMEPGNAVSNFQNNASNEFRAEQLIDGQLATPSIKSSSPLERLTANFGVQPSRENKIVRKKLNSANSTVVGQTSQGLSR